MTAVELLIISGTLWCIIFVGSRLVGVTISPLITFVVVMLSVGVLVEIRALWSRMMRKHRNE
jgi:hypothetical protein